MEEIKQRGPALGLGATWRAERPKRSDRSDGDDDDTFAGTPEEFEALLESDAPPPRPHTQRRRWPLGVTVVIVVVGSLALWGGLLLILR